MRASRRPWTAWCESTSDGWNGTGAISRAKAGRCGRKRAGLVSRRSGARQSQLPREPRGYALSRGVVEVVERAVGAGDGADGEDVGLAVAVVVAGEDGVGLPAGEEGGLRLVGAVAVAEEHAGAVA